MTTSEFVKPSPVRDQICFLKPTPPQPQRPLFVYFPGMDGTGELFHTQVPKLAKTFDIRCLSIPLNDQSNWDKLLKQTVSLIEAELTPGQEREVYICGESFGGCLALEIALKAPHVLDRLILVNPASSFQQQPWIRWGSYLTQWTPPWLYPASVLSIVPLLASFGRMATENRQALLQAMQSVPQHTSIWRLGLLRSFELNTTQLRQFNKPVLAIAGAADFLLPSVSETRTLAKYLPKTQMVVLPQSGHACLLENDIDLSAILAAYNFYEL